MNFSADFLRKYGVKQFQPRNGTANCEFELLIPFLIVLQLFAIWIILILSHIWIPNLRLLVQYSQTQLWGQGYKVGTMIWYDISIVLLNYIKFCINKKAQHCSTKLSQCVIHKCRSDPNLSYSSMTSQKIIICKSAFVSL